MEFEVKFQIPAARRAAVRRALDTATARQQQLRALYVDTAEGALARADLALRLRYENGRWVQALKGRGDGVLARLEHEVVLTRAPQRLAASAIDPARHAASEAGALLASVLADDDRLVEVLRTQIRRLSRRIASDGALIEIALDEGVLLSAGRRAVVCELEFELVSGPPEALPALAVRWARRHALWWDVRTKAERGRRLAQGVELAPPVKAARSDLAGDTDLGTAFAHMLLASLAHALPNLAEIADGTGGAEHLHQLRVALRRLRTVLRSCEDWGGDAQAARTLEAAWREPFMRLGALRERDIVATLLVPRLASLGLRLPVGSLPGAGSAQRRARNTDAASIVCAAQTQSLLLRTLALALGRPMTGAPLAPAAAHVLRSARRRVLKGERGFAGADPDEQHRVRKRLKRLRYLFELLQALYAGRGARRMQRRLAAADDALGHLNDLVVSSSVCAGSFVGDVRADAVLARLAAERAAAQRDAGRRLRALAEAECPWRSRRAPM